MASTSSPTKPANPASAVHPFSVGQAKQTAWENGTIRLDPPQPGDTAGVPASSAQRTADTHTIPMANGASADAVLGRFSDDNYGPIDPQTRKLTPSYENRLVWAVTYASVPMVPLGGSQQSPHSIIYEDHITLVDAQTGAYLMAMDQPHTP